MRLGEYLKPFSSTDAIVISNATNSKSDEAGAESENGRMKN
jgi:hypothetical protein